MEYEVNIQNNFCRVFELPKHYPNEYCFGNGVLVAFRMVDWFNPIVDCDKTIKVTTRGLIQTLRPFILSKQYVSKGRKYLVLFDFGASIIIDPNE